MSSYYEAAKEKYRTAKFETDADKADYEVPLKEWKSKTEGTGVEKLKREGTVVDVGGVQVILVMSDIANLALDCVVNAANESLLGGGGVDKAIHDRAGSNLVRECATHNGCEVGRAVLTKGYHLPASFVIHTVAPLLDPDTSLPDPVALLACYRSSFALCTTHNFTTIGIPLLGCGFYAFPVPLSARIVKQAIEERGTESPLKTICLCFVDKSALRAYNKEFAQ
eukprot:TRINITY_DN9678_c0_g1_i1.p1 TRINITY_DN9678_c0_g1~~TRINITY_DN9678_c0_g1_i1.p1  ORF type:complete len:241 (+),score=37.36 TRINITY_DN9678_c0_g1_i1:52-723(+)